MWSVTYQDRSHLRLLKVYNKDRTQQNQTEGIATTLINYVLFLASSIIHLYLYNSPPPPRIFKYFILNWQIIIIYIFMRYNVVLIHVYTVEWLNQVINISIISLFVVWICKTYSYQFWNIHYINCSHHTVE